MSIILYYNTSKTFKSVDSLAIDQNLGLLVVCKYSIHYVALPLAAQMIHRAPALDCAATLVTPIPMRGSMEILRREDQLD